ncbi:hypothetical protein HDA40_003867 [Hamadaea flava]|uniref:UPF0182 family protein n=1 Tax=Hamadaea flava TaxID=1742688 RepID=A0ABV8LJ42_9ACTN|nr:UPF0182 family protein [Hamadaea flava]MCP2325360.1 hypothetical protein [Hamadaea flava]
MTLAEHPPLGRRGRTALVVVVSSLAFLLVLGWVVALWTDWLWFDEVGFRAVLTKELGTRVGLFVVATLATGLFLIGNLALAVRLRPFMPPGAGGTPAEETLDRMRFALAGRLGRWLVLPAAIVATLFGLAAQGHWQTWLLFRNAQPFGQTDPLFHRDIGYYVFELPFWQFLLGIGFTLITLALLGSTAMHVVYGGVRLRGRGDRITPGARTHLTALIAAYVGLKAMAYELDKSALVLDGNSTYDFNGAGYTDVHAVVSAKEILSYLAIVVAIAILVVSNAVLRNLVWPGVALGLLLISAFAIGGVVPWWVQTFKVNQTPTLEQPYVQDALRATRAAYGLGDMSVERYDSANTEAPATLLADQTIAGNMRLLDPAIVDESFTQLQQVRPWYDFGDKLDVDRYTVKGQTGDYVIGLRGIDYAKLTGPQANWQNKHMVYTHGYGLVAAPADRVGCGGGPYFVSGFLGTSAAGSNCSAAVDQLDITEPRIYYGEGFDEYAVVGGSTDAPIEYDRPSDEAAYYTYAGSGGVRLDSAWRKTLYSLAYMETRFLLNDRVTDDSKILYVRDPRDRVQKIAPFLTLDGDPYPAVVDGRVLWIVDGYTTSAHYPYAQRVNLRDATNDALTGTGTTAQAGQEITYLRNSVKATVDAYDGTVTLYEFDPDDPVLKAWNQAFGGIITPNASIPTALAAHFRYPEDLFKVQRDLLTRYHVADATSFAAASDQWKVPSDPAQPDKTAKQPPYYLYAQFPGDKQPQFQLVAAMTPGGNRHNLAALVTASYAGGKPRLRVLELPKDTQTAGPNQAAQLMEGQEAVRTDINIWGKNVQRGNLLSLPYADGMLYIQPLYVNNTTDPKYPQLRKILALYGTKIGYADTLEEALAQLAGAAPSSPSTVQAAVAKIQKALADLKAAQRTGDFVAQGKALADLEAAVQAFSAATSAPPAGASPSPTATPPPSG